MKNTFEQEFKIYQSKFQPMINPETGEEEYVPDLPISDYIGILKNEDKNHRYYALMEFNKHLAYNYGGFFFVNYGKLIQKFNKDGDTALIFRYLYLCTYTDYEGYLRYKGYHDTQKERYMKLKDLKEIYSNMNKNLLTAFKKQLFGKDDPDKQLLFVDEDKLRINENFVIRGSLPDEYKDGITSTRAFRNGIQELYRNSEIKEHKRLGLLVLLLPYVNVQYNILCRKPNIPSPELCDPLNTKDIMNLFNYSYSNESRLLNTLKNATVGGAPVLGKFSTTFSEVYIINPRIFYMGSQKENLSYIESLMDIHNK